MTDLEVFSRLPPGVFSGDEIAAVDSVFGRIEWAENEIAAAIARHPYHRADPIWHSFALLNTDNDRINGVEMIYRAHSRELLERVAAGRDTRPGTAVEALIVLMEVSKVTPMNTTGTGLYFRLWESSGLPSVGADDAGEHYEALRGSQINDVEAEVRRRLTQPARALPGALRHVQGCPAHRVGHIPTPRTPEAEAARVPRFEPDDLDLDMDEIGQMFMDLGV